MYKGCALVIAASILEAFFLLIESLSSEGISSFNGLSKAV